MQRKWCPPHMLHWVNILHTSCTCLLLPVCKIPWCHTHGRCDRYGIITRKPCSRKETAWCRSCAFRVALKARLQRIQTYRCKTEFVQVKECLNGIIGQWNQETLSDWSSYIREILKNCLNDAQPIGGPGTVVQLDEAYTHGRRKNHVGRLMCGNGE